MLDTEFISQLKRWHLVSNDDSRIVIANHINSTRLVIASNNGGFKIGFSNEDNEFPYDDFLDDPRINNLPIDDVVKHINEDIDYVLIMDDLIGVK